MHRLQLVEIMFLQISQSVTRFTEEFDFIAMNEKFNKDEVWGDLVKSNKAQEDADNPVQVDDGGVSKCEVNVR